MSSQVRKKESTPDQRNLSNHMYDSITIKNFRCFKEITIESFNKVNLITGYNNAGKTTFLEALYLLQVPNSQKKLLVCNIIREIKLFENTIDSLWSNFFYFKDLDHTINIVGNHYNKQKETLAIKLIRDYAKYTSSGKIITIGPDPSLAESISDSNPLKLESKYKDVFGKEHTSYAVIRNLELDYENEKSHGKKAWYLSSRHRRLEDDVRCYSQLELENKHLEILEVLQKIEPRLKRLVVYASFKGGQNLVYADIGLKKPIPLEMMGGGINKLFSLYMAIILSPNGIVLIDEIETGFHYSELNHVWKTINELAIRNNVQVFATTHSLECIRAAHNFFSEQPSYDFSFYRLDNWEGKISYVHYEKDVLGVGLDNNRDVR